MTHTDAQAREQILDAVAEATDHVALALACLGEAYEQLDEHTGDRLEEQLFRPVQTAYGRMKRTHAEFAERYALAGRAFETQSAGAASQGASRLVERAVDAVRLTEALISNLQDSMLPVEYGDAALRSGLTEVRTVLDPLPARARELMRTLGR